MGADPGRRALLFLVAAVVAGCVPGREPPGTVPAGIVPVPPQSATAGAVGAVAVPAGTALPPWAPELSDGRFRAALENALRQAGVLVPGGAGTLQATVLDVAQPPSDPSTTKVVLAVHYRLVDGAGRAVLERRVASGYTATLAQAVQGVDRLRIARQGAMRQNIEVLLRELGSTPSARAY